MSLDKRRKDRTFNPFLDQVTVDRDGTAWPVGEILRRQAEEHAAQVDAVLTKGEGELSEELTLTLSVDYNPGLYRWVRIYRDEQRKQAIGTFYLHTVDGVLQEMWLARARKGMPPSPGDRVYDSNFLPENVKTWKEMLEEGLATAEEWQQMEEKVGRTVLPDHAGSQGVKGLQPTTAVKCIRALDRDYRWQFPGFKVRSTVLAAVLLKLRDAEVQRVPLSMLRQAIDLHQTATSGP